MKIENFVDPEYYYIYAETAFIHEGDGKYLSRLIEDAKRAEADGIKFQVLLDIDNAYGPDAPIYPKLASWAFTEDEWLGFIDRARSLGLDIIILPIDIEAARFCVRHEDKIAAAEIHPICFNDYHMLMELANLSKPVILGFGGREHDEIDFAVEALDNERIIMMYGFQAFPTRAEDLRLRQIRDLEEKYGYVMGYADHTAFDDPAAFDLAETAYLYGARVFEKHISLEPGAQRIDFESSAGYESFRELRARLSGAGDGEPEPQALTDVSDNERIYRAREKQLVYTRDLEAGHRLGLGDISYKIIPDKSDLEQRDILGILGKEIIESRKAGEPVMRSHLGGVYL